MKPDKKLKIDDNELEDLGFVTEFDGFVYPNGDFVDNDGKRRDILIETEKIEKELEERRQNKILHLRWSKLEIERAKKIADKKGLKYHTYIKSVLKQVMDKDEKELGIV